MKRLALTDLKHWLEGKNRKPLILRGARQVGKSTLVKIFCEQEKLDLFEFNLEIEKLNSVNSEEFNIQSLLDEIQFKKKRKITENSLLFFDEIQESPQLLKMLRYFYEKKPLLKVIAAGSLLEIALRAENFSFPVGRVDFYYLRPMDFKEFLWATNQDYLEQKLANFEFDTQVHKAAISALRNYFYVGGMPEAVKVFHETESFYEMRSIQNQIIQAYSADFPKYNKRINLQRINRIFNSLSIISGKKIIYSKLDYESKSRDIKRVVELLFDARVVLPCYHSNGNNVPLAGESDLRIFKSYYIDIGLLNSILKLDISDLDHEFQYNFSTKGMLAEQFVAQHLSCLDNGFTDSTLFYHLKDKGIQKAEIDFLIEIGQSIYPIEVKSSSKGHLKSLMYFCESKKSKIGFQTSLAEFSVEKKFIGKTKLVNIPLYAIGYLKENIDKL